MVTDNDLETARSLAAEIAMRYWQRRHDLESKTYTPEEAIAMSLKVDGGPVILDETPTVAGNAEKREVQAAAAPLLSSGSGYSRSEADDSVTWLGSTSPMKIG